MELSCVRRSVRSIEDALSGREGAKMAGTDGARADDLARLALEQEFHKTCD